MDKYKLSSIIDYCRVHQMPSLSRYSSHRTICRKAKINHIVCDIYVISARYDDNEFQKALDKPRRGLYCRSLIYNIMDKCFYTGNGTQKIRF